MYQYWVIDQQNMSAKDAVEALTAKEALANAFGCKAEELVPCDCYAFDYVAETTFADRHYFKLER